VLKILCLPASLLKVIMEAGSSGEEGIDSRFEDSSWLSNVLSFAGGGGAAHFMRCCRAVLRCRFFETTGTVASCCWRELVLHNTLSVPEHKAKASLFRPEMRDAQDRALARAISQERIPTPDEKVSWLHIGATRLRCSICQVRGHGSAKLSFYRYAKVPNPIYECSECIMEVQPLPSPKFTAALGLPSAASSAAATRVRITGKRAFPLESQQTGSEGQSKRKRPDIDRN
jgi:hypothetical protein